MWGEVDEAFVTRLTHAMSALNEAGVSRGYMLTTYVVGVDVYVNSGRIGVKRITERDCARIRPITGIDNDGIRFRLSTLGELGVFRFDPDTWWVYTRRIDRATVASKRTRSMVGDVMRSGFPFFADLNETLFANGGGFYFNDDNGV